VAITHLFGHACDVDGLAALCRDRDLALIEDCSHAHGATIDGRPVGTFGDASVFSTGAMKLVSGGMGGVLLTSDDLVFDRACLLGHFKQRSRASITDPRRRVLEDVGLGGKLRMSPPAAVLASSHVRRLDDLVAFKARNVLRLLEAFDDLDGVEPLPRAAGVTMGGWHDVVVAVDERRSPRTRDELVEALVAKGVRARAPSTRPLHAASVFTGALPAGWLDYDEAERRRALALRPAAFPVSERLTASWISLPSEHFNDEAGALVEPYVAAIRSVAAGR
jgi:dTDP-4-amino-4,6-dideoxygalactose transaminase